jgi:DNA-binding response OmpR family regulator
MRQCLEGPRILIVEDEPLTGLTLAEMLNEEGHRTIGPISSRKEALAMLDRTRPDCVVLDLSLTDGSSAGLGRELRARGTPFIVFSGYAPDQVHSEALDGIPWVRKPARVEAVTAALRDALPMRMSSHCCSRPT